MFHSIILSVSTYDLKLLFSFGPIKVFSLLCQCFWLSHWLLRSRVDELSEFGLNGLSVRVQSWVVLEFGLEDRMGLKLWVEEDVVGHAEHHAVANCDLITRNKATVAAFKLPLTVGKERSPLGRDQLSELLVPFGRAGH